MYSRTLPSRPCNMPSVRASLVFTLLTVIYFASAIPHAHQKASNDNDEFWTKKPIHTTDLMAGKARMTVETSATYTRIPAATPKIQISIEETNEL